MHKKIENMEILLQPDSLSLAGSMNKFEIYALQDVTFILRDVDSNKVIVQHTYTPSDSHRISIQLKDVILPLLSFKVSDATSPYVQDQILKMYSAVFTGDGTSKTVTFSVLRAGVDKLNDSADNFLKTNFLTWQPSVKGVTYYSPEFLTYYAAESCILKCKAYVWNGVGYEEPEVVLATMTAGKVWTIPVQYSIVAKLLSGNNLPSYYDVWVETPSGTRLTYVQRYFAEEMRSEEEEWFLFENSLGGIDCFRAYGNSENTAEHTHNVADIEEDSEEYRVDTVRKFKKNTGYLDRRERQWLLDFFTSLGKYRYHGNFLRKITVTESDVNYEARELPSNYTFTYKYSDARPYLNLSRPDVELTTMDIHVPDVGNFTIAPRLVEFPRQTLSGGALFPVQSPYSEEWGVTTLDALYAQLMAQLSEGYKGGGGIGHTHNNYDLLSGLSDFLGYILYNGEKLKAGLADEADDFAAGGKADGKILRKDIENFASALIQFKKGAIFGEFLSGIMEGTGGKIDERGNAEFESITSRSSIVTKEIITNRQTAIESNFFATESGLVESVSENPSTTLDGSTTYVLQLQRRWEGDYTAFKEQDCIRGSVNTLMEDGRYYDMWFRVLSVNIVENTITVVMYPDSEVPSGKNYPPCELARLIRWGNPVDVSRQRVWYLSADSGTIVLLNHVTKPIIDRSNYSIAIGLLPSELSFVFQDYPEVDPEDGAIYTKWIAAEKFVRKDYEGNVKRDIVDRGTWSLDVAMGESPYRCTATEVHDVWWNGCKWRCLLDKTTLEPKYASQGWAFVEGNPEFTCKIFGAEPTFDADIISLRDNDGKYPTFTTLSVRGYLYNEDVTEHILAKNVMWTRDTGDANEDNIWAIAHAGAGFSLPLTWEDLGNGAAERSVCTFKVTVEIIDETANVQSSAKSMKVASDEADF